eukprot:c29003_g1_i4 orf=411-1874(+)
MTRVVVQRGLGTSNTPQSRSSSSSSSSTSAAPTPPPLPPPFVPLSSIAAGQIFPPSSSPSSSSKIWEEERSKVPRGEESYPFGDFGGVNSDACFRFLECHYSDSKVRDRDSAATGKSQDEDSADGHTTDNIEGRNVQSIPRLNISASKVDDGSTGIVELHSQYDFSDHGRCIVLGLECRATISEYERARMQQEDVGLRKSYCGALNEEAFEGEETTLSSGENRTQSFPTLTGQTRVEPVPSSSLESLQLQSEVFCPVNMQTSSGVSSSHLVSRGPESSLQPQEEIDQLRPTIPQKTVEITACSIVASSCPLPVSPSPRRSSWIGPSVASGSRTWWTSQKVPRNVKNSRNSPPLSCSTSPPSFGEGDGYNSADEQNAWGTRASLFEHSDERELQFEIEIRHAKGLDVRRMSEDGNCLFRAIADQVYGDAEMYEESRQMCIDYMEKERDHFSQFVTESFTAYCKRKRRDKANVDSDKVKAAIKAQQDQQ